MHFTIIYSSYVCLNKISLGWDMYSERFFLNNIHISIRTREKLSSKIMRTYDVYGVHVYVLLCIYAFIYCVYGYLCICDSNFVHVTNEIRNLLFTSIIFTCFFDHFQFQFIQFSSLSYPELLTIIFFAVI